MRLTSRFSSRRDDRGATAIVAALLAVVLLGVAALTVDIGMQRVARTDMQSLADIVALDLARELGTESVDELKNATPSIQTLANESRDRNSGTLGEIPVVTPALGFIDEVGEFVEMDGGAIPTAVRVAASTEVEFAFGVSSSGGANRLAISQQTSDTACFELGSFAAALNLGDSIIGPLADWLSLDTELTLASYQALADVDLSLLDIAAGPTIGSPDALLDPSGVRIADLLDATIFALEYDEENGSAQNGLALGVLRAIKADSGLDLDGTVVVPNVVSVDAGDTASLAANLNVLELIGTSLALANGENFLATSVPITIPGIGNGIISLTATQGPRRACGYPNTPRATARQSQISISLTMAPTTIPIVKLGSTSIVATVGPISLTGGVGNAVGVLTSVDHCGDGTSNDPDEYTVGVSAGLASVALSAPVKIDGTVDVTSSITNPLNFLLDLLGLSSILGVRGFGLKVDLDEVALNLNTSTDRSTVSAPAELQVPANARTEDDFVGPISVPDPPQSLALGDVSLPTSPLSGSIALKVVFEEKTSLFPLLSGGTWVARELSISVDLANLNTLPLVGNALQGFVDNLDNLVNQSIVATVNDLLGDLIPLLGLSGSGADVYSVARPICGGPPQLVG